MLDQPSGALVSAVWRADAHDIPLWPPEIVNGAAGRSGSSADNRLGPTEDRSGERVKAATAGKVGCISVVVLLVVAIGIALDAALPILLTYDPAERRHANLLEMKIAGLPGVTSARIDVDRPKYGGGPQASVGLDRGATPDQIVAAARATVDGLRGPELADVSSSGDTQLHLNHAGRYFIADPVVHPPESLLNEVRAWLEVRSRHLSADYSIGGRGSGLDRRWTRLITVERADVEAPAAITDTFRVLREISLPETAETMWIVEHGVTETGDVRAVTQLPPDEVLASVEGVLSWRALLGPDDDLVTLELAWLARPGDGAPPRLTVEVSVNVAGLPITGPPADDQALARAGRLTDALVQQLNDTGAPYQLELIGTQPGSDSFRAERLTG
jgi:hypothetical protein